ELENVIERAVVLARGANVEVTDLPPNVTDRSVVLLRAPEPESANVSEPAAAGASPEQSVFKIRVGTPLAEVQQRLLEETLRTPKGNKTLAARMLGIDPKTVFRKLKAGEAEDSTGADDTADDRL